MIVSENTFGFVTVPEKEKKGVVVVVLDHLSVNEYILVVDLACVCFPGPVCVLV